LFFGTKFQFAIVLLRWTFRIFLYPFLVFYAVLRLLLSLVVSHVPCNDKCEAKSGFALRPVIFIALDSAGRKKYYAPGTPQTGYIRKNGNEKARKNNTVLFLRPAR
jgi:hypothetical protein